MRRDTLVDTSVLVLLADRRPKNRGRHDLARESFDLVRREGRVWVDASIMGELFIQLRRPRGTPAVELATADESFQIIAGYPHVHRIFGTMVQSGARLATSRRKQLWDMVHAVSAELTGCTRLLAEDRGFADGERFGSVEVWNPFHPRSVRQSS